MSHCVFFALSRRSQSPINCIRASILGPIKRKGKNPSKPFLNRNTYRRIDGTRGLKVVRLNLLIDSPFSDDLCCISAAPGSRFLNPSPCRFRQCPLVPHLQRACLWSSHINLDMMTPLVDDSQYSSLLPSFQRVQLLLEILTANSCALKSALYTVFSAP